MDKKKLQEIKEAKKKIVDGSLTLWNARLDELVTMGRPKDLINYLGNPLESGGPANVCGCPSNPVCGCEPCNGNCPPDDDDDETGRRLFDDRIDDRINEMSGRINLISQDINFIKDKIGK